MAQFCSVMEIQGSERHILGNNEEPRWIEEKGEYSQDVMLAHW